MNEKQVGEMKQLLLSIAETSDKIRARQSKSKEAWIVLDRVKLLDGLPSHVLNMMIDLEE